MTMARLDKELEQFRALAEPPSSFEDGFRASSLLGTLFVALIMVPGSLYMELIAGMGVGGAAQWVTVLLFVEIAKRANARLSRAQLFILFYMTGLIVGQTVHGTPLFVQFLVRSEAATSFGLASRFPSWVAPVAESAYEKRSFLQAAWMPAIGLMVFTIFFGRLNNAVLGYGLFRLASDVERLPFPMAPLGAQGVMALSEEVDGTGERRDASRWRIFCIGGAVGMGFGALYMGLPTFSGALLGTQPLRVFPIPFVDWCPYTQKILPAVATGLSFDLGQIVIGMVMPFYAILGSFVGQVCQYVANPILYRMTLLHSWEPGQKTVETLFKNNIDLYFSLGIGLSLAVAVIGLSALFRRGRRAPAPEEAPRPIPKGRGDMPRWMILGTYLLSTTAYVVVSGFLVDWHRGVMLVLAFFAYLYTPLISYVTARLEGLAGQVVEIPFIREMLFILSGYRGVAVWFIPLPKANFGSQTVLYKQSELLGCRFTSLWKTNFLLFPIIVVSMIGFSSYIWSLAEVPSAIYPYTQEIWEFEAKNACLVYSSTLGEYSRFEEALSAGRVATGFGLGLAVYGILSGLNAPVLLFYGFIRGLSGALPHVLIPQFAGACVGRFFFQRKFGAQWRKIIPVFSSGYFVGAGLVTMFCIGIVFLVKATSTRPY